MRIHLDSVGWRLLTVSILATLVNGIAGPIPIRELGGELWTYLAGIFIATTFASLLWRSAMFAPVTCCLWRMQFPLLALIAFSSVLNMGTILTSEVNGSAAIVKLASALVVYGYTFAFSLMVAIMIDHEGTIAGLDRLSRIFVFLGWAAVLIAFFEIATWFLPGLRRMFVDLRSMYSIRPHGEFLRLNGLSYEPSFFAAAQLCAVPWVVYHIQRRKMARSYVLLGALFLISYLSGSRTQLLGAGSVLFALVAMAVFRQRYQPLVAAVLVVLVFVIGPAFPYLIENNLSVGSSVSDITRSKLAITAITAGLENPLGLGFGQANAAALQGNVGDGFKSWEIDMYFSGQKANELPPVYNWFARTVAEIGVIGYVLITVLATGLVFRCVQFTSLYSATQPVSMLLVLNVAAFFAIGVSSETYRFFALWAAMIVAASSLSVYRETAELRRRSNLVRVG